MYFFSKIVRFPFFQCDGSCTDECNKAEKSFKVKEGEY